MPRKKAADSLVTAQKWHPPLKGAFLEALRNVRFVTQACDLVKVPRRTVYEWRDADPAFVEAMEDAEQRFVDTLREKAARRALGEEGMVSDEMLKAYLKARAPEFHDKAATQINLGFVEGLVDKFLTIINRVVPIKCPGCGMTLDARKRMAEELGRLDAIEVTATNLGG